MEKKIFTGICFSGSAPSNEDLKRYREEKNKRSEEALNDEEKQTPMLPIGVISAMGRLIGLCPKCNHCISLIDLVCDECFQRIDWNGYEKKLREELVELENKNKKGESYGRFN